MTPEERVISLHMRIDTLRERKERRKIAAMGAGCGALAVCLVAVLISAGRPASGGTAGLYSGATMLFENAGGYVTAAIAAFTAGVLITVACIRYRMKHEEEAGTAGEQKTGKPENTSAAADGQKGEEA